MPIVFSPITDETYQKKFETIFRRKDKEPSEEASKLKEVKRTFGTAGGHKKVYSYSDSKLSPRDLGWE